MIVNRNLLIQKALSSIGLSGYVFDITADEINQCAQYLEMMMAAWNTSGVRIGYPVANLEDIQVLASFILPDGAIEAIVMNLATRIAPMFGKNVPPEISLIAERSYNSMIGFYKQYSPVPLSNMMPLGAGNKRWGYYVNYNPVNNNYIDIENDSRLDINV